MPIVNGTINIRGRRSPFRFPAGEHIGHYLQNILSGTEYPLPPLPAEYRVQTVVDVGANVGASAIWFSTIAAAGARIICFEPSSQNFECLKLNLQAIPEAELFRHGLHSQQKQAALHLGAHQCMEHSVVANAETGTESETIELKSAAAEFDRLNLNHISILKIDTEGCELDILGDLGQGRLGRVDILYIEWHSDADRRRIDAMLCEAFLLTRAIAPVAHRGTATYLARKIAEKVPSIDRLRIGS